MALLAIAAAAPESGVVWMLLLAAVVGLVVFMVALVAEVERSSRKVERDYAVLYRLLKRVEEYPVPRLGAYETARDIQQAIRKGLER